MRSLMVALMLSVLVVFCVCQPAMASHEFIGYDANMSATLKVVVVDSNSGKVLNVNTLAFQDYNQVTTNFYIAATADVCENPFGIYEANMPTGAPACICKAVFIDYARTTPTPVYITEDIYWDGVKRVFIANTSGVLTRRMYNPALTPQ